jgi:hypothetical protein
MITALSLGVAINAAQYHTDNKKKESVDMQHAKVHAEFTSHQVKK